MHVYKLPLCIYNQILGLLQHFVSSCSHVCIDWEKKKSFVSCSDFVGYSNSMSNIIIFPLSYTELIILPALELESGFWRDSICFSKHRKCYHSKHCVHWIINIFSFKVVCFFSFQVALMLNGKLENCCWVGQEIKCAHIYFLSKISFAGLNPKLNDTTKAMANRNVYPNCVLIILSSCYIRFIIIFQFSILCLPFQLALSPFFVCYRRLFGKFQKGFLVPLGRRPRRLFTLSNLTSWHRLLDGYGWNSNSFTSLCLS